MPDSNKAGQEPRLIAERRDSLTALRKQSRVFANDFRPSDYAVDLHRKFAGDDKRALAQALPETAVAGRVMLRRVMGKAGFVTIQDRTGRIQCYIRSDRLAEEDWGLFLDRLDIGDLIAVSGHLMRTNTGELTVSVTKLGILAKAIRPLPDKHSGLVNTELRYRRRYLDLIMNPETRKRFEQRSKIVAGLRAFFLDRDFLEVETPIMHPLPGGAAARPFKTHHNSLDIELYLRVAPELYLKRLVVGGLERVFELNRNFRNEGISTRHNPEFTMLEFYQAYADYHDLMDVTEELLKTLAQDLFGEGKFSYQGQPIDFTVPIPRMTLLESLIQYTDYDPAVFSSADQLRAVLQNQSVTTKPEWSLGKLQSELFDAEVEAQITTPVFITEQPIAVSPLARRNSENPEIADRFELFVMGFEIANGFSELNDPEDQAERFRSQVKDANEGEAMSFDVDYITALEYGMPPTAGEGIGVDRLVMLLTDSPGIRDVLLFPQLKPVASID